ncbi:hypothetical protein KC973_02925, partial [Candidatus Saccharibacteria bacterium]|nr:hypothetical protein [Candidatus Saccharibacteria bacterium]
MSRLICHDRKYLLPSAENALALAQDGQLQAAEMTAQGKTYNPYYFEPENDQSISDVLSVKKAIDDITELGAGEGDVVYMWPNRSLSAEPPVTATDFDGSEFYKNFDWSVYPLSRTGIAKVTFREGEFGSTHKRLFHNYYYEIELQRDPQDIFVPDMYDAKRPELRSSSLADRLRTIRRFKLESALGALGVCCAAIGSAEALSNLDPVTTPVLLVGSFAILKTNNQPFRHYSSLHRDYR